MRQLSASMLTSQALTSYRPSAEFVIKKERAFWTGYDGGLTPMGSVLASFDDGRGTNVLPESSAYDSVRDRVVTAFVLGADVYVTHSGISTAIKVNSTYTSMASTKPALVISGNYGYVFYARSTGTTVHRTRFDLVDATFGGNLLHSTITAPSGSCHSQSPTKVMIVSVENGSYKLSVASYGTAWTTVSSPDNITIPQMYVSSPSYSIFSAAITIGSYDCFYVTNPYDGSVLLRRKLTADDSAAGWEDVRVAIPTDMSTNSGLSVFRLVHAGFDVDGTTPYLVGQFWRNEELAGSVRPMRVFSVDSGLTFSIGRESAFTTIEGRFHYLSHTTGKVIAVAKNRYMTSAVSLGAAQITIPAERIKAILTTPDGMQVNLASGDEYFETAAVAPMIKKGHTAILRLGFMGAAGAYEYIDYGKYVITGISKKFADGVRSLTLKLAHYGMWRIANVGQPFYTELESKISILDGLTDLSNMYVAPDSGYYNEPVVADFWTSNAYEIGSNPYSLATTPTGVSFGSGFASVRALEGAHAATVKIDIRAATGAVSAPEITALPLDMSVYYWSHLDELEASGSNDAVYPLLMIEKKDGTQLLVKGTLQSTSTSVPYPRPIPNGTPHAQVTGSLPVIYRFAASDGIEVGDKINDAICIFYSPNTTHCYPERIEINNTIVNTADHANTPWEFSTSGGLEVPGFGYSSIMLSTNPYSAFEFAVEADFNYDPGLEPADSLSTVAWGVVGLANDGKNFFAARYNKTKASNKLELIRVKNGVTTVLTSTSALDGWTTIPDHSIMLTHKNNVFYVRVKANTDGENWPAPVITYTWDKDYPIVEWSETHTGIYGLIQPLYVRINGFDPSNYSNIGVLPGFETNLASFPAAGNLFIEGNTYTYASKLIGTRPIRGPLVFTATYTEAYDTDGVTYGAEDLGGLVDLGVDIRLSEFWENTNGGTNARWQHYNGHFLSSDGSACKQIIGANWMPHITWGQTRQYYCDRSRFYIGEGVANYMLSSKSKTYICNGFVDVQHEAQTPNGGDISIRHLRGSVASLYITDKVRATRFFASSANHDTTVADMVKIVAGRAGTTVSFPGDKNIQTINLTTISQEIEL